MLKVPIAEITDYGPCYPTIKVTRHCNEDIDGTPLKSPGDLCVISVVVAQNNLCVPDIERELVPYIKANYFGQVYGCKFKVSCEFK